MTCGRILSANGLAGSLARASCCLSALIIAGCASATIEDAVPAGALQTASEPPASAETAATAAETGPLDTGTYPDLNRLRQGALAQMTPQERQDYLRELEAAKQRQENSGGAIPVRTSTEEMKRLANSHEKQALKQIEEESSE